LNICSESYDQILRGVQSKSELILNSEFNLNYPPYLQLRLALSYPSFKYISDFEFEL